MIPNNKFTYDAENHMRLKQVAAFLKEYRLQSGLTQELLSEYAELNRSTVIKIEKGNSVSFISICKYASGLDLSLHQLFLEIE